MRIATHVALLGACITLSAQAALASVISFDPDGPGVLSAINVASFDILPGSSLNQTIVGGQIGSTTTVLFQAHLGSFLDANGAVIQVPGLNDPTNPNHFQITVTAQFNVTITSASNGPGTSTTVLALSASQPTNFVHYYYSNTLSSGKLTAVDLTGVGFTDGTLIAAGSATSVSSVFTTLTSIAPTQFDNFGNNDWGTETSITGIGGTAINASVSSVNPAWFLTPGISTITSNTTNALTYNQADPSKLFFGSITPNIGAINGVSGPDIEFQTDAVSSFVLVPEPASLTLLGLGTAALLTRRRKA